MGTERTTRVTPTTGDLTITNNVGIVTGLLGIPFNTVTGTAGVIPVFDQNGIQINLLTVLPSSFIPTLSYTTPSQVAARIHARM